MRQIATQSRHSQSAQSRGVSPRPGSLHVRRVPVAVFSSPAPRSAFTLVELMIAITIMLLLTVMTVAVVNNTIDSDRVPSGARQVQAYLEGARDRAISSSKTLNPGPRGVRFIRDPNGPTVEIPDPNDSSGNTMIKVLTTVSSMVYIGPPQKFSDGLIEIGTTETNGTVTSRRTITPRQTDWNPLQLRKFILNGARIEIPRGSGLFYTIINRNPNWYPGEWELTKDYPASRFPRSEDYALELEPAVLPNQQPLLLPRNVVIDVAPGRPHRNRDGIQRQWHSRIPLFWNTSTNFQNRMDVLFSPQGTAVGRSAVGGFIHLVVTDLDDAEQLRFTGDPRKEGDERIITINARTGSVTVHNVNPPDASGNVDPFRFAETGEEL
jgi:prepilin-type N-terminal cleavage/methylation domain-containing protein